MRARQQLLPVFLILSCLVLLLIPFYYVDLWSVTLTTKVTSLESAADQRQSKPLDGATTKTGNVEDEFPVNGNAVDNETSSLPEEEEEDDRSVAEVTVGDRIIPRPQVAPPFQHNYDAMMMMAAPFLPFQQQEQQPDMLSVVDFALRLARDRLLVEIYGPAAFHRHRILGGTAGGGNVTRHQNAEDYGLSDITLPDVAAAAPAGGDNNNRSHNQVLIVTYFRGGTTFFGDILNEYPGTFYHFEPLHMVSQNDQVESAEDVAKSVDLLRHLLRCQYESLGGYLHHVRHANARFLFEHNRRLWFTCQFSPSLCFEPRFLSAMCRLHPVHVLKVVRLRLAHIRRLLQEFPQLRVIYLVRDPRGLYSSRRNLAWCNVTRSCIDPYSFCGDMRHDLSVAAELRRKLPDRFLALRYEDISIDTANQMASVLRFLGLGSRHRRIDRFISSHTRPRLGENLGGPYSTKRDSRRAPFMWRRRLSPREVAFVEDACSDVIKRLNFT